MIKNLHLISGPCAAENHEQVVRTASMLHGFGVKVFRAGVWKPRTKPGGFEGCGEVALSWLQDVQRMGMKVAVEVATSEHVMQALHYGMDILWIGARTSADPFAVQVIADALGDSKTIDTLTIMIKNPINPDVELWIGAVERIRRVGIKDVIAVHRGFSSYEQTQYRNQPMWQVPMEFRRRMPEVPLYCDPSHIGGKREMVAALSQQALDLGFDGLMIESHCCPEKALSDALQQVTPSELHTIIKRLVIRDAKNVSGLDLLRREIDVIDDELLDVIARRMKVSREIGHYKSEHNLTVFQSGRYGQVLQRLLGLAQEHGVSSDCIKSVFEALHEESVRQQMDRKN